MEKLTEKDFDDALRDWGRRRREKALVTLRVAWKALADAECAYWPDGEHCYVNGRIGGLTLGFSMVDSLHMADAKGCKCGAVVEGKP